MRRLRGGFLGVLLLGLTALLGGCGSGHLLSTARTTAAGSGTGEAADVAVIRDWSEALQRGDVSAAAGYFALPSVFVNGVAVQIGSRHTAEVVNESLSCGAQLVSTRREGRYILATFTLVNRRGPGADCGSGTGQPAATDFLIAHGRIVDWIRAPVGGGVPPTPTLTAPSPVNPAANPPASV